MAAIYAYFFPGEKELYLKKARDAAESRFQAGIHFRTDNEVALILGKKVADAVIERVKKDGADNKPVLVLQKKKSKTIIK